MARRAFTILELLVALSAIGALTAALTAGDSSSRAERVVTSKGDSPKPKLPADPAEPPDFVEPPRPDATNVEYGFFTSDQDKERPAKNLAAGGKFVVKGKFLAVGDGHPSPLTINIVNDRNVTHAAASALAKSAGDAKYQFTAKVRAPTKAGRYTFQLRYNQQTIAQQPIFFR